MSQVPNNLGKLTNLRTLAIGHKLVKSIPEPVLQLTGLEELAITYCKLQRLPSNLAAMHRLRCLNLQGNPWLQAGCLCPLHAFPLTDALHDLLDRDAMLWALRYVSNGDRSLRK